MKDPRDHYLLDNRIAGRKCVTIYTKDYCSDLVSPTAICLRHPKKGVLNHALIVHPTPEQRA